MVVRASSVLTLGRRLEVRLAALLGLLALWDACAGALPALPDGWDVALTALVLIPTTFAVVWVMLPLADGRGVIPVALATGVLAALLVIADAAAIGNVTKLVAYTLAGFGFLSLFEALSWVVLVSVLVPWVDVASVYHGPTKVVVEERPGVFEQIAISFRLPGESTSSNLGPPDVLFFALYLATTRRFGLRVGWTWIAMTSLLGLTLVLTYVLELNGLPALPAISLGFLLPNADLLWGRWRAHRAVSAT